MKESQRYFKLMQDFLFPRACCSCSKVLSISEELICNECMSFLDSFSMQKKEIQGKKFYYAFQYRDRIRQLIISYKFEKRKELSKLIADIFLRMIMELECTDRIIVPVPVYHEVDKPDHMALIASELSKAGLSVCQCVQKNRQTRLQAGLSRKERLTNLKGAFECQEISAGKVLIIDDVITTGATFLEMSRVLTGSDVQGIMLAHSLV